MRRKTLSPVWLSDDDAIPLFQLNDSRLSEPLGLRGGRVVRE